MGHNGDVFTADYTENDVHRISLATGTFSIVAGLLANGTTAAPKGYVGQSGYSGDGSTAAGYSGGKVSSPRGVTVDLSGNVYIADTANNVVRKVTASTGIITTIVGIYPGSSTPATAGSSGDGGPATSALISAPEDVAVDAQGNVYVADFGNNKIRMVYMGGTAQAAFITRMNPGVTPAVGSIYTVVGGGTGVYTTGGTFPATSIAIASARKIALDKPRQPLHRR